MIIACVVITGHMSEIMIAGTSGCAVVSDKTSQEVIDREPRLIVKWSRVEENSEPLATTELTTQKW